VPVMRRYLSTAAKRGGRWPNPFDTFVMLAEGRPGCHFMSFGRAPVAVRCSA
jgi:hypothetical protein